MEGTQLYSSTIEPRIYFLQALYLKVDELHSELAGQNRWDSFRSGLAAALEAVRDKVLKDLPHDAALGRVVKHLSEKKSSAAVLFGELMMYSEKAGLSSDHQSASAAVAVSTVLASFVQAFDEHLVAFLSKDAYVSLLVSHVTGSEFLRSVSSPWGKLLDSADPTIVPASQQLGFLAAGLALNHDLLNRLQAAQPLSRRVHTPVPRTETSSLTTDFVFWAGQRNGNPYIKAASGDGSLEDLGYGKVQLQFPADDIIPTPLDEVLPIDIDNMGHDYSAFIQSVNSHLASLDEEAGSSSPTTDVLIVVHGFMTKFGQGDIGAAGVLKHDMKLFGTSIAYCWPSQGTASGYFEDEKAVAATVPYLASFIKLCITQVKARRLQILAHSMGNRAMIGALSQILTEIASGDDDGEWLQSGLPLKNVIASAADWTVGEFEKMVEAAKKVFSVDNEYRPLFSVYCSNDDKALWVSNLIHGLEGDRLGLTQAHFKNGVWTLSEPPKTGFIDVIDATGFTKSIHMYFIKEARVLEDTQQLISVLGKERAYMRASNGSGNIYKVATVVDGKTFEFYCFNPEEWRLFNPEG